MRASWSRLGFRVLGLVAAALMLSACDLTAPPGPTQAPSATATVTAAQPALPLPPVDADVVREQPIMPASERFPFVLPSHSAGSDPADLEIQGPSQINVGPGDSVAYTLTVENHGPGAATGIVLTNALPAGLVAAWVEPVRPVCNREERTVRCDLGQMVAGDAALIRLDLTASGKSAVALSQAEGVNIDLAGPTCAIGVDATHVSCQILGLQAGAVAQVQVGAQLDGQGADMLAMTAGVNGKTADPDPGNNRVELPVMVARETQAGGSAPDIAGAPSLAIRASGPDSVMAGQPVTYTYTVTNLGSSAARGVTFWDIIPSDMDLLAYAPALPQCQQAGDSITCVVRDPTTSQTLTFTVVISGHGDQPMLLDLDPLQPGWPICTVLTEASYLRVLICELGALEPDQESRVEMVVEAIGVVERTTTNVASVTLDETELEYGTVSVTSTIGIQVRADLELTALPIEEMQAAKSLSYTLLVSNLGPSDADDVVLTDVLPPGVELVSAETDLGRGCQWEEGERAIACGLGRLVGGGTASVAIVLVRDNSLQGTDIGARLHRTTVAAEPMDPNPGNNELSQPIPAAGED